MIHLVLGGAGFIGRHLTHTLLADVDNRVVIIDNCATSSTDLTEFDQYGDRIVFRLEDIAAMDDSFLLALFSHCDYIYHLAGSVGVEYIDKDPSGTLFNNMRLANKLIPLFEQAQKHVVFSSTSEIYGNGPFAESDNANIGSSDKLRWGYATAKLMTEFMIRASTFPYTIVRFFNVVGPGQVGTYGMVLPRFIEAAKANKPMVVYGNGEQMRSFCHVADAVEAMMLAVNHPNELFNIGNDTQPISMEALAVVVRNLAQSSSEIKRVPYEDAFSKHHGDIDYRVPDLSKLKRMTGYTPKYSLTQIVEELL